jgi:hypothetical protein
MYFRQDHYAYQDRLQNYIPSTWENDLRYAWIER